MDEYIKREALLKSNRWLALSANDIAMAKSIILGQPAADVIEVVRCKDCMWSETIKSIVDGGTMRVCHYGLYRQSAPDMHFCSHGHKKMDGKGEGE